MAYQILIVDDDSEFRQELCESLDEYQILEASSGRQALELVRKPHMLELVILDFSLPDVVGTEVLKQIKKLAPELGIFILTGYGSKEVAVDSLRGQADDYIEKPADVEYLRSAIQRFIQRKDADSSSYQRPLDNKIQFARNFLERNFNKKVSLNQVAEQVFLSPKYFSRAFKKETGSGFSEYRLKIKVKKAQGLLRRSSMTVQQIAEQFGYQNLESFIRIFKKYAGATPQEWRRDCGRKSA